MPVNEFGSVWRGGPARTRTVTSPMQITGGYIAPDGTTHLEAIFEVDSAKATHMQTLIGDMESSDYVLRVTDAAQVTTDVPVLIEDHFGHLEGGLVFFALFDPIANIEQAEVVDSGTSSVLTTKTADGETPTVTILEPTTGSTVSGSSMMIRWQGNQTRSDTLLYRVFYSGDGGNGWYEVATTDDTSITVDTATLPDGINGLLRVYVSDGLNSSFTDATGLTLPNSAPLVTITPRSMTGGGIAGDDSSGLISFPRAVQSSLGQPPLIWQTVHSTTQRLTGWWTGLSTQTTRARHSSKRICSPVCTRCG